MELKKGMSFEAWAPGEWIPVEDAEPNRHGLTPRVPEKVPTGRYATVTKVNKTSVVFSVERRIVDRRTGEIKTEGRERTVLREHLPEFLAGYLNVMDGP